VVGAGLTATPTRWRAARLAALLSLVALLALSAPAPAGATPSGAEYAVNVQTLFRGGSGGTFSRDSWARFLGQANTAGVHAARFDALWSWAEPSRPQGDTHNYDWAKQDDVITALARAHMRWKAVLAFLPSWAMGPNGVGFPAQYHDDFAAFAAAVAQRYGPGGAFWAAHPELQALPVTEYEVWTEPNSTNYWQPTPDSAEYWGVYAQVRNAIKAVNPNAEVLVSLGWQDFTGFLGGMRSAAGDAWAIDGVAFHPYAPTPLGIITLVQQLRTALRSAGSPDVPIHVWEVGWPRAPSGPGVAHSWDPGRVSDATRAVNLTLASDALLRSDCGVPDVTAYSLVEKEVDPNNWEQWFGLYNTDGSATDTMVTWAQSIPRYRNENPPLRLSVCDSPAIPGQLLPLWFTAKVTSPGCISALATYDSHPLEQVTVAWRTDSGAHGHANTDTSGTAEFCLPSANQRENFDLTSSLGRIAEGRSLRCSPRACHVPRPRAAATRCSRLRILAPRTVAPSGTLVRMAVGLACSSRTVPGRRLRVYGISAAGTHLVLRTVRTRSRRVPIVVPLHAGYTRSLVVSFEGVRALGMAPSSRRVALR
jgi:polysaccharide biosynthesis protein PslG